MQNYSKGVKYAFNIRILANDNPSFNSASNIWYKDDAGNTNRLHITISLIDTNSNILVLNQNFPIRLALLYGSGEFVAKQDLLQVFSDTDKLYMNETGSCDVKLRINDVSKNHQKQSFAILVTTDATILNHEIYPGRSVNIIIKSKSPKRSYGESQIENLISHQSQLNNLFRNNESISSSMNQLITYPTPKEKGQLETWAENVIYELDQLRWKIIGYDSDLYHNLNTSKPMYQMQNPNDIIERILKAYSDIQDSNTNSNTSDTFSNILFSPNKKSNFQNIPSMNLSQSIEEKHVYYMMSEPIRQTNTTTSYSSQFIDIIGSFPAYDAQKRLSGFYREMQNTNNATVILFLPLRSYIAKLSHIDKTTISNVVALNESEIALIENSFIMKLGSRDGDIFDLSTYNHDLEKMKQDCMVHYWLHEMDIFDPLS